MWVIHSAKFLAEFGALVVGLCEFEGAIYNADGLDVEAVFQHRKVTGSILGYPGAKQEFKNSMEGLEQPCDILVPAALENQITIKNIRNIQAKIIAEGANGPTTPEAEAIFYQNGGIIIPDMYANAGGVTVSYFEWLKNLSHVAFGRMNRRFEENSNLNLVNMVEGITGVALSSDAALNHYQRRIRAGTGKLRFGRYHDPLIPRDKGNLHQHTGYRYPAYRSLCRRYQ